MSVCIGNCTECIYADCIYDGLLTLEEIKLSKSLDKEVADENTPKEVLAHRESSLKWYYNNRESQLEKGAEYRETHREELRETARVYHAENREVRNQANLANYYSNHEDNKKRQRDAKRKRYQENKEYYRQKQREYRQRRKELQNANSKEQQAVLI